MRLPNGYGSVYKVSGNRRKPWAVVKSEGYDRNGKLKRKLVGYTATKEEGLELLAKYNKKPWDVKQKRLTFSEVFDLWLENDSNDLAYHTKRGYISKYKNYCQNLYDTPYADLRTYHFEKIVEESGGSNGTKNGIIRLFRQLDNTALKFEVIDIQYAHLVKTKKEEVPERRPFSKDEIQKLWEHKDEKNVDIVLVFIYTGMRRNEFASLNVDDIDLEEGTIKIRESKTQAGKRTIPIHDAILPIMESLVKNAEGPRLLPYSSDTLARRFKSCMKSQGMDHIPHEARHTLSTRLDDAGVNRKIINLILGHRSDSVGERVYTHKTISQLKAAINLLK